MVLRKRLFNVIHLYRWSSLILMLAYWRWQKLNLSCVAAKRKEDPPLIVSWSGQGRLLAFQNKLATSSFLVSLDQEICRSSQPNFWARIVIQFIIHGAYQNSSSLEKTVTDLRMGPSSRLKAATTKALESSNWQNPCRREYPPLDCGWTRKFIVRCKHAIWSVLWVPPWFEKNNFGSFTFILGSGLSHSSAIPYPPSFSYSQ